MKHTTTILLWVILAAAEVQSQQESECYAWAVKTTGLDPFDLSKQAQQQIEQQNQTVQKATTEQIENFKKAFAVCLEAKDYMVKF